MLPKLNFPQYEFKFKMTNGRKQIFDAFRKKFILLTPEEWVRQHIVKFLCEEKQYPSSLMVVEKTIILHNTTKRCDVVFYNKKAQPLVIVECKAASIKINQKVFDQIARYSLVLHPKLLIVTNGISHFCCSIDSDKEKYKFYREIPDLKDLNFFS